ncbi:Uncharacterised protein (plasmid) [Tsukamurella tyrosinosolvens]|uniref:Uncharacterized protein n=1 Tax=Tsukamurella tyrosinosolvens TaxID=57704 RepID=A0A1H4UDS9_TSUTY|nr:hypothetical protein [Tsukamurella tyrosinosolvens]KXO92951.1 hypothetical protein AXK58_13860 [Tsukamurella tyrosinosolvens]SEC66815.1 hypothetical protein SAMN04489793_2865 [Tsukamurella tyrosinosolvens]VEH94151.1 Uncharacterised protein [Tsukamurella tyrosinosolvens]
MHEFVAGRPVWLLGLDGVLDGRWSKEELPTFDLSWLDDSFGDQRWYPALVSVIASAVERGIDVRWLTSFHVAVALRAYVDATPLPELPVLTEELLPDGYVFPGGGWTGTAGRVMWEADLVRHAVPDTSPLLWTPGWSYLSESSAYQCGDPARGRRPADVIDSRSGATTILLPKANPRLSYMTKGDLKTVDRWIARHGTEQASG